MGTFKGCEPPDMEYALTNMVSLPPSSSSPGFLTSFISPSLQLETANTVRTRQEVCWAWGVRARVRDMVWNIRITEGGVVPQPVDGG
jgi:hypothetical protein